MGWQDVQAAINENNINVKNLYQIENHIKEMDDG